MANSLTPRSEQAAAKRRSSGELLKTPQSGVSLKIRESTNELKNFLQQWHKHHMTGLAVLSSIKTLKLEAMSRSESDSVYPFGLQDRCHELQKVLHKMESCITTFTLLVQQLDALVELDALQGGSTQPVGIFMDIREIQEFLQGYFKCLLKRAFSEDHHQRRNRALFKQGKSSCIRHQLDFTTLHHQFLLSTV